MQKKKYFVGKTPLSPSLYTSGSGSMDPNEYGSNQILIHITSDNFALDIFSSFINNYLISEHSIKIWHNILDTHYIQVGSAILSPASMAQGDVADFSLSGPSIKTCKFLYNGSLYQNGQNFLDIQYISLLIKKVKESSKFN